MTSRPERPLCGQYLLITVVDLAVAEDLGG
jgi:hypothetical protein